jgi:subtilisin family serine protease
VSTALFLVSGCSGRGENPLAPAAERPSAAVSAPSPDGRKPGEIAPPRYNLGGSARPKPNYRAPVVPGQVVVKLEPGFDLPAFHAAWGTSTIRETPEGFALLALAASNPDPWGWVAEMAESGACEHVEPNFVAEAPESHQGTLPFYEGDAVSQDVVDQDALLRIETAEAHSFATGAGIVVAVLDTGIDATHPDLAGSIGPGWDFLDEDADASEELPGLDADGDGLFDEAAGHGTHVAGLVHAVAPDAMILPARVLDSEGRGTSMGVARAIRWAAANGANVVNLSLGMYVDADVIKKAIQDVRDYGVVVVNAAGNLGREDGHHFPSRMSHVISVAASDEADRRAPFSNWGSSVTISAPGSGILSTFLDHGYATWSGTSMSAPLVSGAVALRLEMAPSGDPDDAADALEETAAPLDIQGTPWEGKMGAGRLDCAALVLF